MGRDVIPLFGGSDDVLSGADGGVRADDQEPPVRRPPDEPTPPGGATSLPDREDRRLVATDLDTNFLVEAGAGSGKTSELVNRMVALVLAGRPVGSIAAVTFTRKAAAELRERFQDRLEEELAATSVDDHRRLLASALQDVDQAFVGTIHAFCAHLLRERPIEAGIDPGFAELLEFEATRIRKRFWSTFLERAITDDDPSRPPRRSWPGCGRTWRGCSTRR